MVNLYKTYIDEYKVKSKKWSGVVGKLSPYNFLKNMNNKLGGNTSGGIFKREKLDCIIKNNQKLYNKIMEIKDGKQN